MEPHTVETWRTILEKEPTPEAAADRILGDLLGYRWKDRPTRKRDAAELANALQAYRTLDVKPNDDPNDDEAIYDAFLGDERVGYLRFRHGRFTVEFPDVGGELLLESHSILGDGEFDPRERARWLDIARRRIEQRLAAQHPIEREPEPEPVLANYVVMALNDRGEYVPATHRLFTAENAARYASGVANARKPRVVAASEYLLFHGGWVLDEGQTPPARLTNRFRLG